MDEFFAAVCRGDGEAVQGMLERYDNNTLDVADEFSFTPLMYSEKPGIALLLLLHKHNVHTKDNNGRTPLLHRVLNQSDSWLFYALIREGADIMMPDNDGYSALQFAMVSAQEHKLLAAWIKSYFCGKKAVEDLSFDCVLPIISIYEAMKVNNISRLTNELKHLAVYDDLAVLERVEVYFDLVKVMIADDLDE